MSIRGHDTRITTWRTLKARLLAYSINTAAAKFRICLLFIAARAIGDPAQNITYVYFPRKESSDIGQCGQKTTSHYQEKPRGWGALSVVKWSRWHSGFPGRQTKIKSSLIVREGNLNSSKRRRKHWTSTYTFLLCTRFLYLLWKMSSGWFGARGANPIRSTSSFVNEWLKINSIHLLSYLSIFLSLLSRTGVVAVVLSSPAACLFVVPSFPWVIGNS